ncbi:unnamed protein product, partial [Linum tenue]
QTLVQKIDKASSIRTETGIVCRSIRSKLEVLNNGCWKFIQREGNAAAHIMAHRKTRWNETMVWWDTPPDFLADQLLLDGNGSGQ